MIQSPHSGSRSSGNAPAQPARSSSRGGYPRPGKKEDETPPVVLTAGHERIADFMGQRVTFKGTIRGILYPKGTPDFSDGAAFYIFEVQAPSGKLVKVKGPSMFRLERGKEVTLHGIVTDNPKYKEIILDAKHVIEELPATRDGLINWLTLEVPGVGKKLATTIVEATGIELFSIIEKTPERLSAIKGVGAERAKAIVDTYTSSGVMRQLLSIPGLTTGMAMRIYGNFGDGSLNVIRKNPYDLTKVKGIGFQRADDIARGVGIVDEDPRRLGGAILFQLEAASDRGDTMVDRVRLIKDVMDLTDVNDKAMIAEQIDLLTLQGELVHRDVPQAGSKVSEWYSLRGLALAERHIAIEINRLMGHGAPLAAEIGKHAIAELASLGDPDTDQEEAASGAFKHAVSVVTGGPGCGKTSMTRSIARAAHAHGLQVVLCAPTGKASRRITEATGFAAKTAHSLLGWNGSEFRYTAENPMPGDVFIMDEASMTDVWLARPFLEAIPNGARLIITGDDEQLASVGPGNFLRDLKNSNSVPVFTLKTIHRTALNSDIVVNAHRIIAGEPSKVDLKGERDFRFDRVLHDENTAETENQDIAQRVLKHYKHLRDKYGVGGVQVLAAMKKGDAGVYALNQMIRDALNPPRHGEDSMTVGDTTFRRNDRVMMTKNSPELGVANGETGTIAEIDLENKLCQIDFGENRIIAFPRQSMLYVDLADAMTVHKSQGSEYDAVVISMPKEHLRMLDRNLFYTAVTRAKKEVVIVGRADCARGAVAKSGSNRNTGLAYELRTVCGHRHQAPRIHTGGGLPGVNSATEGLRMPGEAGQFKKAIVAAPKFRP